MFIVEMSTYESDFINKSTKRTGAYNVRTFDINHEASMFAYYYEEYIRISINRYNGEKTTIDDWNRVKSLGVVCGDLYVDDMLDIFISDDDNQVHVKVAQKVNGRSDSYGKFH